jgi:hypothetical protein
VSEGVLLVGIYDTPCSTCVGVVIGNTFIGGFVDCVLRVEAISVFIFGGADGVGTWRCVALDD